jgi:anti-sigma B factor antagonist
MALMRRSQGAVEIVVLSGTVDAAAAPTIRQELKALIDSGRTRLVLDLSQVRFVDSSGLFALVSTLKAARSAGGDVGLLQVKPAVRAVIELTRLDRVFALFDDEASAVTKLT